MKALTDFIRNSPPLKDNPIIIMGVSMGAAIALNSAAENPDINAVISISSFSSFEDMFCEHMSNQAPAWLTACEKPFVQMVSAFKFEVNPLRVRPKTAVTKLDGRPLMMMHTKQDSQVSYNNFLTIKENAPEGTKFYVRDLDEHFFSTDFFNPTNDEEYCRLLKEFIREFVE